MSEDTKMGHLQNIQLFRTSIETGNLQRYDEHSIFGLCKMFQIANNVCDTVN